MVITNAKIVLIDKVIDNGYVVISNGIIQEVQEGKYQGNDEIFDAKNTILMPGFIDIHTHGTNGVDFMNISSLEELKAVENVFYKEGVTSFLATTLTSDHKSLLNVCKTFSKYKKDAPSLLGIHMEGPYISKKYKGAQNELYIRNPNIEEFEEYIEESNNDIKIVTLALELNNSIEFIKYLKINNICCSCGHSDATREQVFKAHEAGLTNITHTTNGMNKNEGIVDAAKELPLFTEFICDGKHVPEDKIKKCYKIVGPDRFVLITDSLAVKNTNISNFKLFGLDCVMKEDGCYLENGKLAGSILSMNTAIKNMQKWCGCSLMELAKISSKNAAKSIHIDNLGEIKKGFIADLVLLDENLDVKITIKDGNIK